jgi:hypothetical protein
MPDSHLRRRTWITVGMVRATAVLLGALFAAGCGAFGPTFSPTGPCTTDGRTPGAYPNLEAQVPKAINGRAATTVDSGRNCSADALGSLATAHGVREVRFAGATWDESNGNGVSIAVLALPDQAFPIAWAEEFYQQGAENGKHTGNIETARPTYPGAGPVFRLDTLNDLSFQTVVVWPDGPLARVVIVATQVGPNASRTVHDARVAEAVGAAVLADQALPGSPSVPLVTPGPAGGGASPEPVLPSPA